MNSYIFTCTLTFETVIKAETREEAGKKKTCSDCMACDGGISRKGSPVIAVHGSLQNRFIN